MADIVQIKNLYKTYGGAGIFGADDKTAVLKGISFNIKEGSSFGLLGISGSGKTTAAKILLGLEKPTSGQIFIEGKDISRLGRIELRKLRRKVQAVFQDPYSSLDPRMTVREIIEEPLLIHEMPVTEAKIKKLLDDVGLASYVLNRYPHEFSGGQCQRIGIARALALDPKLLVADEPVSALDVSIQAQILNLLKDIKARRNISMLFISHSFGLAKFLCDEVAVLSGGVVTDIGTPAEVFTNPKSQAAKDLLAAILPFEKAREEK